MNRQESLILGIGMAAGAGLMYMLDPSRGRRRRALLRDQMVHGAHELEDAATSRARHLRNRAYGVAAETRGLVRRRLGRQEESGETRELQATPAGGND